MSTTWVNISTKWWVFKNVNKTIWCNNSDTKLGKVVISLLTSLKGTRRRSLKTKCAKKYFCIRYCRLCVVPSIFMPQKYSSAWILVPQTVARWVLSLQMKSGKRLVRDVLKISATRADLAHDTTYMDCQTRPHLHNFQTPRVYFLFHFHRRDPWCLFALCPL